MNPPNPSEKQVKRWLVDKFRDLLAGPEPTQEQLALEIDNYAARLVERESQLKLTDEVWEVLYACLDLHHWGKEDSFPPSLTKRAIRKIIGKWDLAPKKRQPA